MVTHSQVGFHSQALEDVLVLGEHQIECGVGRIRAALLLQHQGVGQSQQHLRLLVGAAERNVPQARAVGHGCRRRAVREHARRRLHEEAVADGVAQRPQQDVLGQTHFSGEVRRRDGPAEGYVLGDLELQDDTDVGGVGTLGDGLDSCDWFD